LSLLFFSLGAAALAAAAACGDPPRALVDRSAEDLGEPPVDAPRPAPPPATAQPLALGPELPWPAAPLNPGLQRPARGPVDRANARRLAALAALRGAAVSDVAAEATR
jgi:hypothetical protein